MKILSNLGQGYAEGEIVLSRNEKHAEFEDIPLRKSYSAGIKGLLNLKWVFKLGTCSFSC